MTVAKARPDLTLVRYEDDVLLWSQEQARLLRAKRFTELDLEHLADEIEDVGKSEKRELASRMSVLLAHLMKWTEQPRRRSRSWQATVRDQRRRVALLLNETPSLRAHCLNDPDWIEGVWLDARAIARKEMQAIKPLAGGIWDGQIWSLEAVCDPAFWPE